MNPKKIPSQKVLILNITSKTEKKKTYTKIIKNKNKYFKKLFSNIFPSKFLYIFPNKKF
jgi:hypothetical protein